MRPPLLLLLVMFSGADAFHIQQPFSPACSFLGKRGATASRPSGSAPSLRGVKAPLGVSMMSGGKETVPAVQRFVTPALGAEETREWTWRGYQIR